MKKSHLKVLAPIFSLFLMLFCGFFSISAEDTPIDIPDDLTGQERIDYFFERYTPSINEFVDLSLNPEYVSDVSVYAPPMYQDTLDINGITYNLCGASGHDACVTQSVSTSSSNDWFESSLNSYFADTYGYVIPVSASASFSYNYYSVSGSSSTSMGYGLTSFSPSGASYDLISYGGAVGRPSSSTVSSSYTAPEVIDDSKKVSEFRCYGGGGSNHGTQSCSASISRYYYPVGSAEPDTFDVIVSSSNPDGGTASGSVNDLKIGDDFTISATTNSGYLFEYWELEITVNDNESETILVPDNPQHFTLSSSDPILGNAFDSDSKYGQIIAVAHFKSLDVPTPTPSDPEDNLTNNQEQSNEIDATISWGNGVSGDGSSGSIAYVVNDYYNLYALHFDGMAELENKTGWTCELKGGNEYECSWNSNHISIYAFSDGSLFLYVYDHSTLQAKGSNLVVATSSLDLYTWPQAFVQLDLLAAFITGDGVISRDTSSFDLTYVDDTLSYVYDEQLIIQLLQSYNSSYDSTGTISYLGQKCVSSKTVYGTSSSAYFINTPSGTLSFYFAISDTMDTFQDIYIRFNQALTQDKQDETNEHLNTIIEDLNDLNNLVENGNQESQQASNYLDITKGQFDDSLKDLEGIETDFMSDFTDAIGNLDISFDLGNNQDFVKSANWVKTQFDKLTTDNPFGILILFSLCVGICLLIIGKRL